VAYNGFALRSSAHIGSASERCSSSTSRGVGPMVKSSFRSFRTFARLSCISRAQESVCAVASAWRASRRGACLAPSLP
jgi:hypothetical protein